MKIAQKLSLRFAIVALIPLGFIGLAGVGLLQRFGDQTAQSSLENVLVNEKGHLVRLVQDKTRLVNDFLDDYYRDVAMLRNRAERICANYPKLRSDYLTDLYTDKERGGLPGYGYIHPEYGAYANWDQREFGGGVWMRRAIVDRVLREPAFRNDIVNTLDRVMPLTTLLVDINEKHKENCDLAWVVTNIGVTIEYPSDCLRRLKLNPGFNDLDESQEDYLRYFDPANNPEREIRWMDPYLDSIKRLWMVSCAAPFYDHGRFMGTVGVDVVLSNWTQWLMQYRVGKEGYVFLLSAKGAPLAIPEQGILDLVPDPSQQNVLREALKAVENQTWTQGMIEKMNSSLLDADSPTVSTLIKRMTQQEEAVETVTLSNEEKLVAFAPVGQAGWSIGIVLPMKEAQAAITPITTGVRSAQQDQTMMLFACLVVFAFAAAAFGAWNGTHFASPIHSLIGAIAEVSRGGKWREINAKTNDELQVLAESANAMIRRIVDNEQSLDAIFNGVSDAIVVHEGATGRILQVNKMACYLFGYAKEEFVGLDILALSEGVAPYSYENALARLQQAMQGDSPTFEWRCRSKDSTFFWGEVSLQRAPIQGEDCVLASIRDITSRKQTEEALRASQEKYRELVENANSIILRMDAAGTVLFVNEYAQAFFGFAESEILGKSVLGTIVPAQDSLGNDMDAMLQKLSEHPEALSNNLNENVCKDGKRVWVVWTNRPVYDETGRLLEILCIGSDVTERRQIEDKLRQAQKMEAIGQLAGGVAHDFNNLLQVINGYTGFLQDEIDESSPHRWMLDEVGKAGDRSAQLVRQLLTFSRRQIIKPEHLAIDEVTSGLLKMIGRLLGEHIQISVTADTELPYVVADRGQIEQVIMNLSVNARDAMPDGGELTIRIGRYEFDETACATRPWAKPGKYVRIEVKDTGCGIDPAHFERIFDPFFTTKPFGEGTGLGLATVYGIVNQHEGLIHVRSEVGQGTLFQIFFPAAHGTATVEKTHGTSENVRGSETLLITEDDPRVRSLVSQFLNRAGYTVLLAQNGQEALELCQTHGDSISLALLDVVMPVLGGRALYEQLRVRFPHMRFLFTSGYNVDAIHRSFVLEDGIDFLPKPFACEDLLRTVRDLLDKE